MSDRVSAIVLVALCAFAVACVGVAIVLVVPHTASDAWSVWAPLAALVGATARNVVRTVHALRDMGILSRDGVAIVVVAACALVAAYAVACVGATPWDYLHRRGAAAYRVITPDEVDGIAYVAPRADAIPPHGALMLRHAVRLAIESARLEAAIEATRIEVAAAWDAATVEIDRLVACHGRAVASRHRARAADYARRVLATDAARWADTTPCYLAA